MYGSVLTAAKSLDYNLSDVVNSLNSYVVSIGKINLKGLSSDDIQKKLEEVLGAEFDKIAKFSVKGLDDLHYRDWETDRKSTRLNSSHSAKSRMPSSA